MDRIRSGIKAAPVGPTGQGFSGGALARPLQARVERNRASAVAHPLTTVM
jgi:hypothetical protein